MKNLLGYEALEADFVPYNWLEEVLIISWCLLGIAYLVVEAILNETWAAMSDWWYTSKKKMA